MTWHEWLESLMDSKVIPPILCIVLDIIFINSGQSGVIRKIHWKKTCRLFCFCGFFQTLLKWLKFTSDYVCIQRRIEKILQSNFVISICISMFKMSETCWKWFYQNLEMCVHIAIWRVSLSRSPGHPYPRISKREDAKDPDCLFQGASSCKICTSRYKKMYIKDNDKANSWHKWTLTHRKEFGVGRYLVPDEGMCRLWPEPTQYSIRIFPEVHILPNLLGMTKVRLSATFQWSCPDTCSAKYQDVLTNWPIGTPDHVSLYFLTRILLIKLQTL